MLAVDENNFALMRSPNSEGRSVGDIVSMDK